MLLEGATCRLDTALLLGHIRYFLNEDRCGINSGTSLTALVVHLYLHVIGCF